MPWSTPSRSHEPAEPDVLEARRDRWDREVRDTDLAGARTGRRVGVAEGGATAEAGVALDGEVGSDAGEAGITGSAVARIEGDAAAAGGVEETDEAGGVERVGVTELSFRTCLRERVAGREAEAAGYSSGSSSTHQVPGSWAQSGRSGAPSH
jgi:hypothetical protein